MFIANLEYGWRPQLHFMSLTDLQIS